MRVVVAAGICLLAVVGAGVAEDFPKAKAHFTEPTFDFGTVSQGTKVVHDFPVENTGTGDLTIQRIVPSCGCTAVAGVAGPIPPGEKAAIHVEFDTSGFSGEKLKTVRIYSNDFEDPSALLTIKGIVQPDVTVEPASVAFDEIIRGEQNGPEQTLTVSVREGAKVELGPLKIYSPHLVLKEVSGSPKKRVYMVSVDPNTPIGELRERIVVPLTGGRESAINVPLLAVVKGQLVLRPAQVSFGIIEGAQTISRSVKLDNRGSRPVVIQNVKSNHPALKAGVKAIEAGKKFVVQLDLEPQAVKQSLQTTVDILTDSPDEPTLSLSVYGITPPK